MTLTCGVEISSRLLKYAVLEKRRHRFHLLQHGRFELQDPAEVSTVLEDLRNTGKIPTRRIRVAAARQTSHLQDLRLPPMPTKELMAVVRGEVERELEVLHEDLDWRSQILPSDRDHRRVLVALTPRSAMNDLLFDLNSAGFLVELLTPASAVLIGHLARQEWARDEASAFAVVHIGLARTVFAIIDSGKLRLLRDLNLGLDTALLDQQLGTGTEDDLDVDHLEALSAGLGQISEVATQIRRTLDYDRRQVPHRPVSKIYLAGDVARADYMLPVFRNEVGIPTELMDLRQTAHIVHEEDPKDAASLAIPLILALEQKVEDSCNFGPVLPRSGPPRLLWTGAAAALAAAIVALSQVPVLDSVAQLRRTNQSLVEQEARLEEQSRLDSDRSTADWAALGLLEQSTSAVPLPPLYRLVADWPDPAWLHGLSIQHEEGGWRMQLRGAFDLGRTGGVERWGRWLEELESDPQIEQLRLEPISGTAAEGTDVLPVAVTFLLRIHG